MSIKILNILSSREHDYVCLVSHGETEFITTVNYDGELTQESEYFFEMGYESIKYISIIQSYNDSMSGIFPTSVGNELCIIGKVSGVFIEDNVKLIDLYIQKGPEFITIDQKDIQNSIDKIDEGLKIIVINLILYAHDKK